MATLFNRQAIFDAKLKTVGYQIILHQEAVSEQEKSDDPESPNLSLDQIVGDKFVVYDYDNLCQHQEIQLNIESERTYLLVTPKSIKSAPNKAHLDELKEKGYKLLLSAWLDDVDELTKFCEYVDVVQFNLLDLNHEDLEHYAELLKGAKIPLLATRVASQAALKLASGLGFDFIQGTYLCHPDEDENKKGKSENNMRTIVLLNTLQNPDVTLDEVEKAVSQDPKIAYRLLLTVNSAAFGLQRKIESIRESLVFIGMQQLKRWASLIALSNIDGKPDELTSIAMTRARMCELLAEDKKAEDPNSFFTTGLFSTLDAMLDTPLEVLMEKLTFSTAIKEALLQHKGLQGQILEDVLNYENAGVEEFKAADVNMHSMMDAYMESLNWTDEYLASLKV